MSEELKSAFEIEGFLAGDCEVQRIDSVIFRYKFCPASREILYQLDHHWAKTVSKMDWFLEKKFRKVEQKKKMFIHEFWSIETSDWRSKVEALTSENWEDFKGKDQAENDFIHIKTTEIEQ